MIQATTQDGYPINIPVSFHRYKIIQYLGCGSSCAVFLVEDENTSELFSAKIMARLDIEQRNMENIIQNEVRVLQAISHPNIIKIQEFFSMKNEIEEEYYAMIMEYCANGDLLSYATSHGFTDESEKKKIITGFLSAVKYLHQNGIAHGDIKSENILLDDNYTPKLCDFGFCRTNRIAGNDSKNGTLYYAAPELFSKGEFDTFKTDIYAIGITLYSLSELQFPFRSGDQNFIIQQIISGSLSIRNGLDYRLKRLVEKCTSMNPQCRPTIEDIIHDEYFAFEHITYNQITNFIPTYGMVYFFQPQNFVEFNYPMY